MKSLIAKTTVFTDGYGRWRARIGFAHTLSESDGRAEYNLGHQWPRLRAHARRLIVKEIADREQKTGESRLTAERRIRQSLPRLDVIAQDIDSLNCWHGVTFGEP